jgi:hypothetical protein
VHDLPAHVHRGAELVQCHLDRLHGSVHPRAVAAGLGQQDSSCWHVRGIGSMLVCHVSRVGHVPTGGLSALRPRSVLGQTSRESPSAAGDVTGTAADGPGSQPARAPCGPPATLVWQQRGGSGLSGGSGQSWGTGSSAEAGYSTLTTLPQPGRGHGSHWCRKIHSARQAISESLRVSASPVSGMPDTGLAPPTMVRCCGAAREAQR